MTDTPTFTIEEEKTGIKGRYIARAAGKSEAYLSFSRPNWRITTLDSFTMPEEWAGFSVGRALVAKAVEDARASGGRILPRFDFAKTQFELHPEWQDVLGGQAKHDDDDEDWDED
ncbi:GNAT family N-acetyltransferase [Woodsholea maritima]|uniref:GNAT family N-acetyltransferase n=1 Tax=Woodsholea maritima TaxID=240237 RepID=UPI00036E82FB|nr:N-acetyltransferase [Woodsholea maritima]